MGKHSLRPPQRGVELRGYSASLRCRAHGQVLGEGVRHRSEVQVQGLGNEVYHRLNDSGGECTEGAHILALGSNVPT